jgi:hypothetical protein
VDCVWVGVGLAWAAVAAWEVAGADGAAGAAGAADDADDADDAVVLGGMLMIVTVLVAGAGVGRRRCAWCVGRAR